MKVTVNEGFGVVEGHGFIAEIPKPKKLAVLIGHNKDSQGAVTPEGVTEWRYNKVVAGTVWLRSISIPGIAIRVFERYSVFRKDEIREAYNRINQWDPDAIIELHFNGSENPNASGTEMLYWGASQKGRLLADLLQDAVVSNFFTDHRQEKPISHKEQDGYVNLKSGKAPTVICEPFFGSNSERKKFIPDPCKLADAYLEAVMSWNILEGKK